MVESLFAELAHPRQYVRASPHHVPGRVRSHAESPAHRPSDRKTARPVQSRPRRPRPMRAEARPPHPAAGSPAVTNGISPVRPAAFKSAKRWSMRFICEPGLETGDWDVGRQRCVVSVELGNRGHDGTRRITPDSRFPTSTQSQLDALPRRDRVHILVAATGKVAQVSICPLSCREQV